LDPIFYTKTAQNLDQQGQPGAKYWQNKADYKLTAILNEKNNEMVQEILTYTNNSQIKFLLWMNVDQNLFKMILEAKK
jgi:restriction endonuclease Mrr